MTVQMSPGLAKALNRRDVPQLYAYLLAASEKERTAAFPAVVAYLKDELDSWVDDRLAAAIGLAVLGCAPTAKKATSALNRGSLRWQRHHLPIPETVDLLAARNLPWLADLARIWADTQPLERTNEWLVVDGLARAAGLEPPQTEGFARGWIGWIRAQKDPYVAITTGTYADRLLPVLFTADDMGTVLEFSYSGAGFNEALIRLAADDSSVRAMLIDGCLARLLRGGRPGQLRAYVTLHEQLSPTPGEIATRVPDYAALIGADLSTAATLAQRCLRAADEAGLLEADTLIDVSVVALHRSEKGFRKTHTTWLRQATKRHPDHAGALLALLDQPAEPGQLEPAPFAAPVVPDLPSPISTLTELAEELAAMLSGDSSVVTTERVLAGLVAFHGRGRAELAAAIGPVAEARRDSLVNRWVRGPRARLGTMLFGLLEPWHGNPGRLTEAFTAFRVDHAVSRMLQSSDRSPATLMELLLHAMECHLARHPVPLLMATPTHGTGHLDPAVLLDRLEQAERDGWQPWHADLAQAMLRLPREDAGPDIRRRAERLGSPAGRSFAQYLRDGHRDPAVERCEQHGDQGRYPWYAKLPDRRVAVSMTPPPERDPIETALFTLPAYHRPLYGPWMASPQTWAAALPSHREVAAGWALARLAMAADSPSGGGGAAAVLPLLAEGQGPTGPATSLALVYGMTASDAADRVATLDAILGYGSAVNWLEVGQDLGDGVSAGSIKLNRAADILRGGAEAGAVETVWQVCAGALPYLLTAPKTRPGVADVLQLATRCARSLGRRDPIQGLEQAAARTGGSLYVTAARELAAVLSAA